MMSLWDKLPVDIIQHIYEYDTTYKEKLNESLNFIEHACPTCCCDGGKKTRYRHYGDLEDAFWNWEWRRRNACPKHNPSEFDKNGFQTVYDFTEEWAEQERYLISAEQDLHGIIWPDLFNWVSNVPIHYEIRTGRTWYRRLGTINYNIVMMNLWMFCTRSKNIYPSPIKTYSRKKLTGARFMDMTHAQRPIAA